MRNKMWWRSLLASMGFVLLGLLSGVMIREESAPIIMIKREIQDFLAGLDWEFIVFGAVAFLLGFLTRRFLNKRLTHEMLVEIEDLRKRLRSARRLLSSKQSSTRLEKGRQDQGHDAQVELAQRGEDLSIKDTMGSPPDHGPRNSAHRGMTAKSYLTQKRMVRLVKLFGKEGKVNQYSSIVGLEEAPATVGRKYRVVQENGFVFSTSTVTKVGRGYIRTQNSVYEIDLLDAGRETTNGSS
jgi:hypothetical protein